ncbi:Pol polyprotein [Thelohanellus kitauei]|nr:Pol polyprotein [Thelohanellus kitauei]
MDITGPLPITKRGNRYILAIQDYFSKFAVTIPLEGITADEVSLKFIDEFALKFGIPLTVHTDMGTQFTSELFKCITKKLGICKTNTTPYHPQSDGMVERLNRTLKCSISKLVKENDEWDKVLQIATFSYNVSKHESTGLSPFEIMYKRLPYLPIDNYFESEDRNFCHWNDKLISSKLMQVRKMSEDSQNTQAYQYDKNNFALTVKENDKVYLFSPVDGGYGHGKLSKPWRGPYMVTKIRKPLIQLKIKGKDQWVHANRCKRAHERNSYETNGENNDPKICEDTNFENNNEAKPDFVLADDYFDHKQPSNDVATGSNQSQTYNLRPRDNIKRPLKYSPGGAQVFPWRGRNVADDHGIRVNREDSIG